MLPFTDFNNKYINKGKEMSVKVTKDEALDYHKFPNARKLANVLK
ncbi:hypothetical protein ACOL2Y_01085 [Aliarcobacter butzleri]